jgi:hypothetical protein
VLTFFAQPGTTANPDHVIQFGFPDNHLRQAQASLLSRIHVVQAGLSPIGHFTGISFPAVIVSEHPPPPCAECGQLLCLRSTVLLI